MSNISMVEAKLPPGFRFHPRDDELVCDYLINKITHSDTLLLIEVDLNKSEPWDIPETACVGGKEWYFYSQRDRKYATGLRTNRATASGYWKATGKDRPVLRKGSLVGMRKTLVFYQGRAPKGRKTDWVMHEYRLDGALSLHTSQLKEDWVLCRLFYKNREAASKPDNNINNSMGIISCYEDTGTSSSSLPPLLDSYITFDQNQQNFDDQYEEQVPCFSIFSHIPQNNLIFPHMELHSSSPTKTSTGLSQILPINAAAAASPKNPNNLDRFSCEKKVYKAVLDQLTKMEAINDNNIHVGSSSLREASCESFLSEVGMSNIWNDY